MQRVGFDRVDFTVRTPAPQNFTADAEQQTAKEGNRNCQDRIERESRGETFAGRQMKQHLVQKIDAGAHRRDDQTAQHADHDREQDEAGFSRPYERPQAPRNLQGIPDSGN